MESVNYFYKYGISNLAEILLIFANHISAISQPVDSITLHHNTELNNYQYYLVLYCSNDLWAIHDLLLHNDYYYAVTVTIYIIILLPNTINYNNNEEHTGKMKSKKNDLCQKHLTISSKLAASYRLVPIWLD